MSGSSQGAGLRRRSRMVINLAVAVAFVIAYFASRNLITATWVLAAASSFAVLLQYLMEGTLSRLPLAACVFSLLSAGIAVVSHDAGIVKVEATVTHLVIGLVMLGGLAAGFNTLKFLFGGAWRLPDATWWWLTLRYGFFVLGLAFMNEIIRRTQSDATWVFFKFPCMPILHGVFWLTQLPTIARGRREVSAAGGGRAEAELPGRS